jgi:molybdopterin synthase sulfur carrier subunit
MPLTVRVPGSLKGWLKGSEEAACQGKTLRECIDDLDEAYPGIKNRLITEAGEVSVLIFLNGENSAGLDGLDTRVNDGDEIGIIPFAAGG